MPCRTFRRVERINLPLWQYILSIFLVEGNQDKGVSAAFPTVPNQCNLLSFGKNLGTPLLLSADIMRVHAFYRVFQSFEDNAA